MSRYIHLHSPRYVGYMWRPKLMSAIFLYCSALANWDSLASKLLEDPMYWDYWWATTPTQLFMWVPRIWTQFSHAGSKPFIHFIHPFTTAQCGLTSPSAPKSATSQADWPQCSGNGVLPGRYCFQHQECSSSTSVRAGHSQSHLYQDHPDKSTGNQIFWSSFQIQWIPKHSRIFLI